MNDKMYAVVEAGMFVCENRFLRRCLVNNGRKTRIIVLLDGNLYLGKEGVILDFGHR